MPIPQPRLLNLDEDIIKTLELDLVTKSQAAYQQAGIEPNVFGVFNIDDLEKKQVSDLCGKLAVGVGYAGADTATPTPNAQNPGSTSVRMVAYLYHIIVAVPYGENCVERYDGTKLLTVLRRGINGKTVEGDGTNRPWMFVKEFPNVEESTDSMLYYSQIWRIAVAEGR